MPLRSYLLIDCCCKSHHPRPNGEEYSSANHHDGTFPPHFLLDSLLATTMISPTPHERPALTTVCLLPSNSQSLELFLSFSWLFTCSDPLLLLMCACPEMTSGTLYRRCGLAPRSQASCRALQRRHWLPFPFPHRLRLLGRDFSASLPGQESVRIRLCISIDLVK
jgi:hypothetical protein